MVPRAMEYNKKYMLDFSCHSLRTNQTIPILSYGTSIWTLPDTQNIL